MIKKQEQSRFDIMIFDVDIEDAYNRKLEEEEVKKKRIAVEKKRQIEEEARIERLEKESKNVCEFCGGERPRWVRDGEFFCCYECFIHDLTCEADVMVPIHRVRDLEEYIDKGEWDEYAEEESEERGQKTIAKCFDVFHKQLGS